MNSTIYSVPDGERLYGSYAVTVDDAKAMVSMTADCDFTDAKMPTSPHSAGDELTDCMTGFRLLAAFPAFW